MRANYLLLLLYCYLLSFGACKPDSDSPCRLPSVYMEGFSQDQLSRFPFRGSGDTLGYLSLAGDSLFVKGAPRQVFCSCAPVYNNPECPPDSAGYEINTYVYADSAAKLTLTINTYHLSDSPMTITANGSLFRLPMSLIGVRDSLGWIDSMPFGNRMFYDLHTVVNAAGDSLYYNPLMGIVALRQAAQRFYIYRFNKN